MDLRNNAVGRNLGATYRFATNNTIKNKVIKAVDDGKLWRVNSKNQLIRTNSSGKL